MEVEDNAGDDLLIRLARDGGPLRRQIEEQLRERIRTGSLGPGTRLPATRDLARGLGVSRGVVVSAYEQLAAEGYLVSRRRGGTFVAAGIQPAAYLEEPPPEKPPLYELRLGFPDLAAFPRREWLRAAREVFATLPDARLAAMDPRGAPELRRALAGYLGRVRGVVASPNLLLVCAGYTQAFHLLCRALWRRGMRRIAFEEPCWTLLRLAAQNAGLEPLAVRVDQRGLRVDELGRSPAEAVVITPAHQFPNGVVLEPDRREALLNWAEERDALIIEDDYDGEFRFDRDPIGALQSSSPDRIVYGGSASKALVPALRVGWLAAPAGLFDELVQEKVLSDGASPLLTELTFARFLERGEYDRHLRRQQRAYAQRRAAVVELIESGVEGARVTGIDAGLHAVIELPEGVVDAAVVTAAAARGIGILRLRTFAAEPEEQPHALVLGYAGVAEPTLRAGLEQLVEAINSVRP